MENWKQSEERAYAWFKTYIDENAKLLGKENSTIGDIYSPKYSTYIEVKDITNGARCGQFTESTIKNNPFAQAIYDGNCGLEICEQFVRYHYTNKQVTHFIIINGDDLSFYSFDDFFLKYNFEVQNPYTKRSGTRSAPKKDISLLLASDINFYLADDGKVYCPDRDKWGTYVSINNLFDYFISKTNQGELRKRSSTMNLTWHLLIKQK